MVKTVIHRVLLLVMLAYLLAPFVWMLLTSVLPADDLSRPTPRVDLGAISFESYGDLLRDGTFVRPMANSAIIALATTAVCIAIGAPAAYEIGRAHV